MQERFGAFVAVRHHRALNVEAGGRESECEHERTGGDAPDADATALHGCDLTVRRHAPEDQQAADHRAHGDAVDERVGNVVADNLDQLHSDNTVEENHFMYESLGI